MTPLQSIAKSIYEARNGRGCVPWSKLARTHQEPYLGDARAALEAMREPTRLMCHKGDAAWEAALDDAESFVDTAGACFRSMIDAALKEG